jgi:hypothetical protein
VGSDPGDGVWLLNSAQELLRANDKLLFVALQHYGRFARSKRRAPLDRIRFVPENNLLTGAKLCKPFVILLWIDPFHAWFIAYRDVKLKSPRRRVFSLRRNLRFCGRGLPIDIAIAHA